MLRRRRQSRVNGSIRNSELCQSVHKDHLGKNYAESFYSITVIINICSCGPAASAPSVKRVLPLLQAPEAPASGVGPEF